MESQLAIEPVVVMFTSVPYFTWAYVVKSYISVALKDKKKKNCI